jgi:DNA-binding FrmR family transcriptional regulator
MTSTTTENLASDNDRVLVQLRRVHGQLGGVIKMYEEDRSCVDIVRQIAAVRSSLGRSARDFLTSEANRCSREQNIKELESILKELFR